MDPKLREKLDKMMAEVSSKYPSGVAGMESVAQTEHRMKKAEAEMPRFRKSLTDEEIEQLRERLKEITPDPIPISHRADVNDDVEATPWNFDYEFYFLSKLLKM